MYDDCLRLIGKHIVDFPLVLIELFSLTIMAEALHFIASHKKHATFQPIISLLHIHQLRYFLVHKTARLIATD